jgi:protein O-mannosyl-transferase
VPTTPAWRRHAVPILVLWALAVLAYSNSFRDGLIYDNYFVLKQDARIRQVTDENIRLILNKDYWYKISTTTLYRPLTTLSYLFNYAILGNREEPAGYHAINLALHAVNVALVYFLGLLLLAEFWPAFAMAAIWAVHPVLTESVTNVVGRADLLAAFGVLVGLLCYARSITAVGSRAVLWQLGVFAATAIGMFSKESGIVVIAAIFLYDIAWCRKAPLRTRIIGYAAAVLPTLAFLLLRAEVIRNTPFVPVPFTDNPIAGGDFWTAKLTAIKVLGKYLWLLFWPARLSCDYSYNQIPLFSWSFRSWEDWQAFVSLAVYGGLAVLALAGFRRSKPLFFFLTFFFAALAPTANLFLLIGTIMAERTLYLPSVAFAGLLAWGGWQAYQRLRPRWPALRIAAPALLAVVCLALCGRTFARNLDWYDEHSLWSSALRASPNSYRPHQHIANWLANPPEKNFDAADREAARAIAMLEPLPDEQKVALVYTTAGFCFRARADELGPKDGAAWYRKALDILLVGEKVDQAEEREFARQNRMVGKVAGPARTVPFYLELARTDRGLGRYQDALNALTSAGWSEPQAEYYEEVSKTYRAMGDDQKSIVALLEGITMNATNQVNLAADVVELYKQTAPDSCALTGSGTGAAINFTCPLVHDELCQATRNVALLYHQMHRDNEAMATASGAINSLGCPADMFR